MKDYGFHSDINPDLPLGEPHFDDELTLQSARQVVPLEKIEAKVARKRRWFLGGAFATAMLLGAASALVASYLKLRNTNTPASEVTQVELSAAPLATEETLPTEPQTSVAILDEIEDLAETEPPVESVAPKRELTVKRKPVLRTEPELAPNTWRLSEEDELERIRAAVLYNEWQERRMRRAARRERRRERASRDLSNLDEIFEGPRRP